MTLTEQLRTAATWAEGADGGLLTKAADELDRQRSQIIRLAGLLQDARDGLESLGEIDALLAEVQP